MVLRKVCRVLDGVKVFGSYSIHHQERTVYFLARAMWQHYVFSIAFVKVWPLIACTPPSLSFSYLFIFPFILLSLVDFHKPPRVIGSLPSLNLAGACVQILLRPARGKEFVEAWIGAPGCASLRCVVRICMFRMLSLWMRC